MIAPPASKFSNRYFHGTKDDIVIVTGDFGLIWDGSKSDKYWTKWFEDKPYTILFVDGNHENFNLLEEYPVVLKYGGIMHQIGKNIFHMIRGQIYAIQADTPTPKGVGFLSGYRVFLSRMMEPNIPS